MSVAPASSQPDPIAAKEMSMAAVNSHRLARIPLLTLVVMIAFLATLAPKALAAQEIAAFDGQVSADKTES